MVKTTAEKVPVGMINQCHGLKQSKGTHQEDYASQA